MSEENLDDLEGYMRARLDIARANDEYMEVATICGVLVEVEKARQLRAIDTALTNIAGLLASK